MTAGEGIKLKEKIKKKNIDRRRKEGNSKEKRKQKNGKAKNNKRQVEEKWVKILEREKG